MTRRAILQSASEVKARTEMTRRENFCTVLFSERNTGAVYLGAEVQKYICVTSRVLNMKFSRSLCQILAPLGAHLRIGFFLSSAKRRVNRNAVRGAGGQRGSASDTRIQQNDMYSNVFALFFSLELGLLYEATQR